MTRKPLTEPTQRLKILISAYYINRDFEVEELAVESWKRYPQDFGMRAYEFPDVIRVYSKVHGADGLIATGMLEKCDVSGIDSRLRISEKGTQMALRLVPKIDVKIDAKIDDATETAAEISAATPPTPIATSVASPTEETAHAQHDDQLEETTRYSPFNVIRKRRDASGGLANSDQANRSDAARNGGASKHVRDASVVLGQRIENGRAIGFEDVASIGGEGIRVAGSGISGNGIATIKTENEMEFIIRPGFDSDNLTAGSRGESADKFMGASDPQDGVSEKPLRRLVRCFYCGAGTAPQYLDAQERPMCGGCHRDLGHGKKVSKKRARRMSEQRGERAAESATKRVTESATKRVTESAAEHVAESMTERVTSSTPPVGEIDTQTRAANEAFRFASVLHRQQKLAEFEAGNGTAYRFGVWPPPVGAATSTPMDPVSTESANSEPSVNDDSSANTDSSANPDSSAKPKKERKKRTPAPKPGPVIDFTVRIPSKYIVRRFDGAKLGGHSEACISTTFEGCIAICPLRIAWEADGRPEK